MAALISVLFQFNYDENIGPQEKGSTWRFSIQMVIPFSPTEDVAARVVLTSLLPR